MAQLCMACTVTESLLVQLLLEHPPTYTLGRRTSAEATRDMQQQQSQGLFHTTNHDVDPTAAAGVFVKHEHLRFDPAWLSAAGAKVVETKRGGKVFAICPSTEEIPRHLFIQQFIVSYSLNLRFIPFSPSGSGLNISR